MRNSKKVLFVNSEIFPYMPESKISIVGRYLPQGTQESGKQIRSFMPRYGCINERRNQLHEVIRLSGMNIVVNKVDRPLVIKVSSISSARMEVYFIDNRTISTESKYGRMKMANILTTMTKGVYFSPEAFSKPSRN